MRPGRSVRTSGRPDVRTSDAMSACPEPPPSTTALDTPDAAVLVPDPPTLPTSGRQASLAGLACLIGLVLAGCGPRDTSVRGNRTLSDGDLLAVAQRPLATWRQERRNADLHDAAYAMQRVLEDQGLPAAEVIFRVDPGDPPKAVFLVDEGPLLHLGSITFTGRTALSEEDLRAFFVRSGGLNDGETPFVEADLTSACRLVERRYRIEGYLDASVADPVLTLAGNAVDVVITVSEGRRFLVDQVILERCEGIPEDRGRRLLTILDIGGQPYHQVLRSEVAARIRAALRQDGHLDAKVQIDERIDGASGAVDLAVTILAGPVLVLDGIDVPGTHRTRDRFIRGRLAGLRVGAPIDGSALDEGIQDLYRTGLFRQVTVDQDGEPQTTRLRVQVDEAPARMLSLSAGYGSYEQVRGSVAWSDDNLFGVGLRWNNEVRASMKGYGAETGLLERHHLGHGRSLGLDLRHDVREQPSFRRTETEVSTTFRHEFRPRFDEKARWTWTSVYALSFNADDRVEAPIAGAEDASYRLSTASLGLQRDGRQTKPTDPDRGTLAAASVRWSLDALGSQVPYTEHRLRWTGLQRLGRRLVGVVNAQIATRDPDEGTTLPIGERLFNGGATSVRSFTQDQLGPKDANGKPLGGLSSGFANLELRWRPWRDRPQVELAAFFDVGGLGTEAWTIDRPLGQGIGGGIRYLLPVGPVRFDAAYNPGERFGEGDPYALHLTVGFAF